MATMSVSGIISGMDWEGMIDEIITNAAKPAQPQVNKKTNLTNKKSLFEEMKVTMNSLQSSLTPLKLPSTYKAKQIDIERLDKNSSYKGVLTATVNADAEVNVWDVKVNQLATAQINRSKQITASSLGSVISGQSGRTVYVNAGGQKVGIEVKSNDTLESLKSRINTTLKTLESPIHVTASVVDSKLILKSDYTGLGTMTATENTNYSSSGVNKLKNITIPEAAYDNVKVTSGSKSYTIHKDFEVANGNEIRWKQYDRGDKDHGEVGLSGSANIKYKMAAGDVYQSKGKMDSSDTAKDGTVAGLSGFSKIDNGTLSKRVKIVDAEGYEYTYGTHFTLDDAGNVQWLDVEEPTNTNEPANYTVSYNKTSAVTSTISGRKVNPTTTLGSECTVHIPMSATVTFDNSSLQVATTITPLTYTDIARVSNELSLSNVIPSTASHYDGSNYVYYINGNEENVTCKLTDENGVEYAYGKDFVLMSEVGHSTTFSNNGTLRTARTTASANQYVYKYKTEHSISGSPTPIPGGTYTLDVSFDKTLSASEASSFDFKGIADNLSPEDRENFTITVGDTTYKYGDNFTINDDGSVTLIDASTDDEISATDWADLEAKYREVHGLSDDEALPLITLTDADGVLRTYLDPADSSLFKMKDDTTGKEYEYGRDYVIRVNDTRDGYVFAWAINGDKNKDGKITIKDADTAVTTYTQYKNISTYGMLEAPAVDDDFTFEFSKEYTTEASGTVKRTDTDKSLTTILKGVTVDSADYDTALTITDGTNTYAYGTDWTIDETGSIKWIDQSSDYLTTYTAEYKFSDTASFTGSPSIPSSGNSYYYTFYGAPALNSLGVDTFLGNYNLAHVTEEYGKVVFTMTGGDGTAYEYGKHYAVRKNVYNANSPGLQIVWARDVNWPTANFSDRDMSMPSSGLTLTYHNIITGSTDTSASPAIADVLGFNPSDLTNFDWNKLTITSDGETFTYVSSEDDLVEGTFTIINGMVKARGHTAPAPTGRPAEGVEYTLTYESFAVSTDGTDTYSGNDTQEVSIATEAGAGHIGGNAVSYEQILSYAGVSSSETSQDKIDLALGNFFSLTDGTNTYRYGHDYRVIQGENTDSDSGEHTTAIEWIDGGNTPAAGAGFTLTFAGGETIDTTLSRSSSDAFYPLTDFDNLDGKTVTITQGTKTYYEGIDFEIGKDGNGKATIDWISDDDGGYEWYYPEPGSSYVISCTDSKGSTTTYRGFRTSSDTLDVADLGMTTANGSISFQYGDGMSYKLDAPSQYDSDGNEIPDTDGHAAIKAAYSTDITKTGTKFNFRWLTPTLTTHSNLPSMGEEITVEYDYDANTFDLEDDADGDLLYALGFVKSDRTTYDDYTAAQDAELEVDGEKVYRASNDIGADYDNELIKGVTMHLKGIGEVSMDISHDAEKAVESIQTFIDNYNDLMSWMNTRMTEKEVDEDTKSTIDSDDFRMRWGLLHGNSLLRNTKSQMRSLTSQNFTFSFTQRKSSEEIYGPMSFNGLKTTSTLRLRIGTKYVDVTINPTDTLETIVKKISDDTKGGAMNDIYYDDKGEKLQSPLLKAYVENDKLVIQSSNNDEITMSGSAALNALKMNYTYKGLYQIGIESTSEDYGKSGELVFDTNEFMEALEDNPDEVQSLMMKFVTQFDTWTKSMLNSSASGETSGTLTREIENIQTQIDSINEYLEKYQDRLDRMEENLRTKYSNTETQFSKLSQQANSIAAILNQLNGTATGGGYGQTSS